MEFLDRMKELEFESWLDLALKSQKANLKELKAIQEDVKLEFRDYLRLVSERENKPRESNFIEQREMLIDFYERPPVRLKEVLKARRSEHGLLECPFCGYPYEPDTLDHFFPKEYWPEFSLHPNNLIPQCRYCMPIKGKKYYCDINKTAKYLHPIFSPLLSQIKFEITVSIVANKFTFEFCLRKPKNLNKDTFESILHHLRSLNVLKRLRLYCNKEIKKLINLRTAYNYDISNSLRVRLNERGEENIGRDWKTALYSGILDSKEVIDFFNSIRPKNTNNNIEKEDEKVDFAL